MYLCMVVAGLARQLRIGRRFVQSPDGLSDKPMSVVRWETPKTWWLFGGVEVVIELPLAYLAIGFDF